LFGAQAAMGAVYHALVYTHTYNVDTDILESIFLTSCEPELISEEPYFECVYGLASPPSLMECSRCHELDATRRSDSKEY